MNKCIKFHPIVIVSVLVKIDRKAKKMNYVRIDAPEAI